jgi:uroporphyrinogen-III decarboxylase
LNVRERFLRTMHFEKVDRPPLCEFLGYWPETIQRWYAEGLPADTDLESYFGFDPGLTPAPWKSEVAVSSSLSGHVDLDPRMISIDFAPIPRYGPRVLAENQRYRLVLDAMGVKKRFVKGRITGMPQFVEHPIKDEHDFEKTKPRFRADDIRRFPLNLTSEMIEYYDRRSFPLGVEFPGFFATGRTFMGTERFLIAFHRNPALIHDIMDFWGDFVTATMETVVSKVRVDFAVSWEDMAYGKGPHISPQFFREFLQPEYRKVTSMLRNKGVDVIIVDSDGNIESLVPPLLDSGINGILPLEAGAGMNAISLRQRYGKSLIMIGNIDKKALLAGPEAIKNEVESKLTQLVSQGGYVPSIDHEVPADVALPNYRCYADLLKRVCSEL